MSKKFSNEDKEKCIPMIRQIVDYANFAMDEGMLALEEKANQPGVEPLLTVAVNLIVDGVDPRLVQGILEKILETEQYEGYELLKAQIIAEGALALQAGEHPRIVKIKLASYIGLDYVIKVMPPGGEE